MPVQQARCAGLEVHKKTVVAGSLPVVSALPHCPGWSGPAQPRQLGDDLEVAHELAPLV